MSPGSTVTTTRPFAASVTSYPRVCAIVLSGSVPSARPWMNSRPLISFFRSALTVPYVLLVVRPGIVWFPVAAVQRSNQASFIGAGLSGSFRTSSFQRKYPQLVALFINAVLASTRIPKMVGGPHDRRRKCFGRARCGAACLFSGSGDVSLDQAARPEDISQLNREG